MYVHGSLLFINILAAWAVDREFFIYFFRFLGSGTLFIGFGSKFCAGIGSNCIFSSILVPICIKYVKLYILSPISPPYPPNMGLWGQWGPWGPWGPVLEPREPPSHAYSDKICVFGTRHRSHGSRGSHRSHRSGVKNGPSDPTFHTRRGPG